MLDAYAGKDHRKEDEVVRFCIFQLVLGEEGAPLTSYPHFMFGCATPLCPPLLRTEGPAATEIAILDYYGLIAVATPIGCSAKQAGSRIGGGGAARWWMGHFRRTGSRAGAGA